MPNTEYEDFYRNVESNEDMLREMATNPESAQAVFDKIMELCGDRGMPGSDTLKLLEKIGSSVLIKSEVAANFSDLDMLKLYGNYFEKWFQLEGFGEAGAGFGNPVFSAIQAAFTSSTKNNHVLCFEYLITNAAIGNYDVDALDLLIALKERKVSILELMYLHADKETYGTKGPSRHILGPAIQAEFDRASRWLDPTIHNKLREFSVIGVTDVVA